MSVAIAGQLRAERQENRKELELEEEERKLIQAKKTKKESKPKLVSPSKAATNRFLAFSWLNLITSFGLTLIYINIHVFMHTIMPSMFGKLGEEWLPKNIRDAGGKYGSAENTSKTFGLIEMLLLVFLDMIAILILLMVIAMVVVLIDALFGILGFLFDLFNIGQELMDKKIETGVDVIQGF